MYLQAPCRICKHKGCLRVLQGWCACIACNDMKTNHKHETVEQKVKCTTCKPEHYNQYKKCTSCGIRKESVKRRACGYDEDINGTKKFEQVCDDCEHEHLMDI